MEYGIEDHGDYRLNTFGPGQCPLGPTKCSLPVDVVFKVPTGSLIQEPDSFELIGAHTSLLAEQSEGFPQPEDVKMDFPSEPVSLTEDSTTLRLLFIFMHSKGLPHPPVDILSRIDPEQVVKLAIAAEKYVVHYIIGFCRLAIRPRVKDIPHQVFLYATKYGDAELANMAAPYTFGENYLERFRSLPDSDLLAWFKFRESYLRLGEAVLTPPKQEYNSKGRLHECAVWGQYEMEILTNLPTKAGPLAQELAEEGVGQTLNGRWTNPNSRCLLRNCATCRKRAEQWEDDVTRARAEIRSFNGTETYWQTVSIVYAL